MNTIKTIKICALIEWIHSPVHGFSRKPFRCGALSFGEWWKPEHRNRGKKFKCF